MVISLAVMCSSIEHKCLMINLMIKNDAHQSAVAMAFAGSASLSKGFCIMAGKDKKHAIDERGFEVCVFVGK